MLYLLEKQAADQKSKAVVDSNMSAPVISEGTMVVVTRVQPVTIPAVMVGNHEFIRGHPLALGVSHIEQMKSSLLSDESRISL